MQDSSRATLRQLLLAGYDDLKARLTRRLGSSERAGEALQETYLRLEQGSEIGPVRNPGAYLLRMAINIATNSRIAESRHLTPMETEMLLQVPDDAPGPAQQAESRAEIEALKRALAELPARRRAIFLAAWVEELPHRQIAERFGVSTRTIQTELRRALEHCASRLGRNLGKKFTSGSSKLS